MIVCSCNVLSDHQIRDVVAERGTRFTSQVYGCLGCSAQCGRCARTIRRIMDQALHACGKDCACCVAHARDDDHHHEHAHHPDEAAHEHDHPVGRPVVHASVHDPLPDHAAPHPGHAQLAHPHPVHGAAD